MFIELNSLASIFFKKKDRTQSRIVEWVCDSILVKIRQVLFLFQE
jgi:hypothetical protein